MRSGDNVRWVRALSYPGYENAVTPHISKERLQSLVFDSVRLTEEEDEHTSGWRCLECQKTMLELAMDLLTISKDDSGSAE
jgi:hypothetical protein